jgi:hypothetical protein
MLHHRHRNLELLGRSLQRAERASVRGRRRVTLDRVECRVRAGDQRGDRRLHVLRADAVEWDVAFEGEERVFQGIPTIASVGRVPFRRGAR